MRKLVLLIAVTACGGDIGQAGLDAALPDSGADAAMQLSCPSDWYDCDFVARQPLTIDYAAGTEVLTDVPVLIGLDASRADLSRLTRDSLRFVDASNQLLSHEVETVGLDGSIIAWVKLPSLAAGSSPVITAYYGNDSASNSEAASLVWSNAYAGVWHLSDDPTGAAPQMLDQSGNANHGTGQGALTADARIPGKIGDATLFDGASQWIEVPHATSLDFTGTTATLSAWIRMTNQQTDDMGIVVKSDQPGSATQYNYQLAAEYVLNGETVENYGNFRVRTDDAADTLARIDSQTLLSPATWYHVTGVYDGTEAIIYINGEAETTEAQIGNIESTTEPLVIGRRALTDERYFDGAIDEVRVTAEARSPAWVRFQYDSMTDQVVSYGAVEQLATSGE